MSHEDRIIEELVREVCAGKSLHIHISTHTDICIELNPCHQNVTGFNVIQENPMVLIAPGNSPQFTATPVPAGAVPTVPPTWTSSDTTNAPVTVDPTGLIATVAIPTTAVVDTVFTLTVSYTNGDGSVATGSISETIVSAQIVNITSFDVAQTA